MYDAFLMRTRFLSNVNKVFVWFVAMLWSLYMSDDGLVNEPKLVTQRPVNVLCKRVY